MAANSSDDFGSRLRAARERKGISLRDIANRTKISVAVLEALERNDISRLPGGIFSRAFVRAYAHEVGLDPETAIQEFIAQFPHDSVIAGHPRSDKIEDTELFESDRRVASSFLWILGASVTLAGAVLYMSVARGGTPHSESSAGTGGQTPTSLTSEKEQPAVDPGRGSETVSESGARAPGASAEPPERGTAPAASGLSSPGRATAASAPVASQPARPATTTTGTEDRLTVRLAARRPVWVSATVDGQKALGRLLQPGEQETIEVTREMVITAGDASAVRLTLNGAEARALGKAGEVVTARLTLANFKDYLVSR